MNMEQTFSLNEENDDLLEPQFYPDPILFRDSLETLHKYEEELKSNIQSSSKSTINVLAPYLETVYKDQKKVLESAKNLSFSAKAKEAKLLLVGKKYDDQPSTAPTDIREQCEVIVSIHETADILKTLIKADTIVSYLVSSRKNELYQSPRYIFSSIATLTWKIETGTTMAAYCAATKQYVLSNNILIDDRFPLGLGFPASLVKYGLCVPIKTADEKVVAVYELTRNAFGKEFEQSDVQLILTVVGWMGFALQYNSLNTGLEHRLEMCDYLLQLTNHYHGGHATLHETLSAIVTFARQTAAAEHSNYFLVEKGSEDTLIIKEYNQDAENSLFKRKRKKNIVRNNFSYLSQVVFGKEILNKFETQVEIDRNSEGLKIRSVICVPTICKCGEVIGVIQLTNKKTAPQFDKDDEEMLKIFAIYFSLNLNMSNKHQEAEKKSSVQKNLDREMLLYQMSPCFHDLELMKKPLDTLPDDFFMITWYPSLELEAVLPQFTIHMFHDVLGKSFMSMNDMQTFILTVHKCYRSNPYHNFTHAFIASHKMANILKSYNGMFSEVECQCLMIAILCHDVDHQSFSNSFIELTDHCLSKLYESSPIENHHFAVTKIIIEKCRLFRYLKSDTYSKLLCEIYECIMATNLLSYYQSRTKFLRLADEKLLNVKDKDHIRLIKNLMMKACDLSDQVRPFPECRKLTEDLYEEYFYQSDVMKKKGLIPIIDRLQKHIIPDDQIQFLIAVILPCLETLSQIFKTVVPLVSCCKEVIHHWQLYRELRDQNTWKPEESIPKY